MRFWLTLVTYLVNTLNVSIFIDKFLDKKSKNSFIYNLVVNEILILINYLFFYNFYISRMSFLIFSWLLIIVSNYKAKWYQCILAITLILTANVFIEIPMITIIAILFNASSMDALQPLEMLIIYIITNVLLYLMFRLLLRVFKKIDYKINEYMKLFLAITVNMIITLYFVDYSIVINENFVNDSSAGVSFTMLFIMLLTIVDALLCIYILRINKRLYKEIYERIMIKKKYELRELQLEEYKLLKENADNLRYLRHDIINYLQYKGDDKNECD